MAGVIVEAGWVFSVLLVVVLAAAAAVRGSFGGEESSRCEGL